MKPSAYLVNTSRAGWSTPTRWSTRSAAGRIAGAGLDVYDVEPLPRGHRLRRSTTCSATPHLGYVTEGNYRTFFTEAVERHRGLARPVSRSRRLPDANLADRRDVRPYCLH